jgi:hypothetical protein
MFRDSRFQISWPGERLTGSQSLPSLEGLTTTNYLLCMTLPGITEKIKWRKETSAVFEEII